MILGDTCTRRCGFCNVKTGKPTWNDPLEPARVARSVARMGLRHAVITSVDRDDLPDLGVQRVRRRHPPDPQAVPATQDRGADPGLPRRGDAAGQGDRRAARRLQSQRRGGPAAVPGRPAWLDVGALLPRVLRNAKEIGGDEVTTKSGLMVGLGETFEEMVDTLGTPARAPRSGAHRRPVPAPDREAPADRPLLAPGRVQGARGGGLRARVRARRRRPARARSYHADQHVPQREPGTGPLAEAKAMMTRRRLAFLLAAAVVLALRPDRRPGCAGRRRRRLAGLRWRRRWRRWPWRRRRPLHPHRDPVPYRAPGSRSRAARADRRGHRLPDPHPLDRREPRPPGESGEHRPSRSPAGGQARERRVELAAAEASEEDRRSHPTASARRRPSCSRTSSRPGMPMTASGFARSWPQTCSPSGSAGLMTSTAAAGATAWLCRAAEGRVRVAHATGMTARPTVWWCASRRGCGTTSRTPTGRESSAPDASPRRSGCASSGRLGAATTTGSCSRSSRAPRAPMRCRTSIVATPWSDETAMHDEALVRGRGGGRRA